MAEARLTDSPAVRAPGFSWTPNRVRLVTAEGAEDWEEATKEAVAAELVADCVAVHPSDLAVVLAALDADVSDDAPFDLGWIAALCAGDYVEFRLADLGMADADARLAKAQLAQRITAIMRERDLTQQQMAEALSIDQPQVSRISRGQLHDFSLERLMHLVNRLDQDIEITIKDNPEPSRPAQIVVTVASDRSDLVIA